MSQIMIFTVVNIKTFFPEALSHFAIMLQVVVFPFVPVTHTIVISLAGKP
ncbi:MAG: hypothetical protein LBF15_00985 [Candidatus Peribacteria bacterium]|nr:hypothetical protein [Candidatus Peribacteria bacterium]